MRNNSATDEIVFYFLVAKIILRVLIYLRDLPEKFLEKFIQKAVQDDLKKQRQRTRVVISGLLAIAIIGFGTLSAVYASRQLTK